MPSKVMFISCFIAFYTCILYIALVVELGFSLGRYLVGALMEHFLEGSSPLIKASESQLRNSEETICICYSPHLGVRYQYFNMSIEEIFNYDTKVSNEASNSVYVLTDISHHRRSKLLGPLYHDITVRTFLGSYSFFFIDFAQTSV